MNVTSALKSRLNGAQQQLLLALTIQRDMQLGSILERLMKEPREKSLYMVADDDNYHAAAIVLENLTSTVLSDAETVEFWTYPAEWTITTGKHLGTATRNFVATLTEAAGTNLTGFGVIIEGVDQFGVTRSLANGNAEVLGSTVSSTLVSEAYFPLATVPAAGTVSLTGSVAWRSITRVYCKMIAASSTLDVDADNVNFGFGDKTGAGVLLGATADVAAVTTAGGAPLSVTVDTTNHTISYNWGGVYYDFCIDSTYVVVPTS